jgi:hypothetical protein
MTREIGEFFQCDDVVLQVIENDSTNECCGFCYFYINKTCRTRGYKIKRGACGRDYTSDQKSRIFIEVKE